MSWQKNILTTFYFNDYLSEQYYRDSSFRMQKGIMQKVGDASLEDPSYVNELNTGIYQLSVGPICMQAVRAKERSKCGRSISAGLDASGDCSKQRMEASDISKEASEVEGNPDADYEW